MGLYKKGFLFGGDVMTDKNKLPVDTNGEGKGKNTRKIFLIVSVSVLVVALAV